MAARRQIWRPEVSARLAGNVLVIGLSGRLGEAGARSEPLLAALTGAPPHDAVVVDLSRLDYVSSPGVAHLAAFNQAQSARAIPCLWCDMPEAVRISLDLAGVLPDFRVAATCGEALTLVTGGDVASAAS
jgi:anti-anti-sigma regulatory factor